ncbi:YjhX family toxin [Rhodopseudomonas palustris]
MKSKPAGASVLAGACSRPSHETSMNISRNEQRALHVLALGGCIRHARSRGRKISSVLCISREGMILADFDLELFERLRRKRLIESRSGSPYRISQLGRICVRAQLDNQGA